MKMPIEIVATDPSDGFVYDGNTQPWIDIDESTNPPHARLFLPLWALRNYLPAAGVLTIVSGAITIPGPGLYIVKPETGTADVLDRIIDTCQIGEMVSLMTDPTGLDLITVQPGTHNITTTVNVGLPVIGGTSAGGVAATTIVLSLVKGASATPVGDWYVVGSAGSCDYGNITAPLIHTGAAGIKFFGTPGGANNPVPQPGAYTPTNVTATRTFDADTVDVAGLADIVGTLLADLKAYGLLA
jgi:hypothetical protein